MTPEFLFQTPTVCHHRDPVSGAAGELIINVDFHVASMLTDESVLVDSMGTTTWFITLLIIYSICSKMKVGCAELPVFMFRFLLTILSSLYWKIHA